MAVVANDSFTAANGTSITARASDSGHTWTIAPGSTGAVTIQSNTAVDGGFNGPKAYSSYTPTSADYTVSLEVTADAAGSYVGGPGARIDTATGTGYYVYWNGGAGEWRLEGAATIGTYVGDVPTTTRTVTLDVSGSTIRVLIGGVQRISVTNTSYTSAGRPGAYFIGGSATRTHDNWTVEAVLPPSGPLFDSAIFSAPPFDTGVAGPTIVSGSFAGAWSVANIVSTTKAGAFSVRNYATGSQTAAFSVRASVAGSAAGAWSVRNSVAGSQSAAFSVRNYATGSVDGAWSVASGTTIVSGSAGGAWSVRNLAAATFSAASSVRNAASATQAGAWSVRAAVSASTDGAWSVRSYAAGSLAGAWSARNYAAGSLSAAWSVGGPVTAEWSGAWSVRGIAAGALTSAWSVLEDVPESHGHVGHGPFAPRRHAARDLRLAMSLAPRIEQRRVEPPPARVPIEVRAPAIAGSWRPAIAHACAPITPPIRLPALMRSTPMPLLRSNNVNRAN